MNLVGKKIIVIKPVVENFYYKSGDVMVVSRQGFKDEKSVLTKCGNLLIKSEYELLGDE